ncbi:immunodominant staphylococcal antigen IsaB family protein [Mammaliicoccus lentus]|uniref:immunodominant staphylococcal antigen IsaB family protein n=1 Tax=Mammaliicoccus lentus TaxID=42858 RepID=UPI003A59997C
MKKMIKLAISGGIAATVLFSMTTTQLTSIEGNTAEAAVTPWYNYQGTTGHDGRFILDKNFKNAVKYNNVTINGYHVYASAKNANSYQKYTKPVKVHDQTMMKFDKNKAIQAVFPVRKQHISENQLVKVWGKGNVKTSKNGKSIYYTLKGNNIKFDLQNGYVTKVSLGTIISNK